MNKYERALQVFERRYVLVPLEVFSSDPYMTLVSTMMSARTNDDTTLAAAQRLFERAPTINDLDALSESEINNLIYPVGFHNIKAKQLKGIAKAVINSFNGKVPQTREELMSLPGVGRKTANLVLNRAFHIPAIAVDIHVHRITNMMGWVRTNTPEETEAVLNETVPVVLWPDINRLFVSLGRQFRSHKKLYDFLIENNLVQ